MTDVSQATGRASGARTAVERAARVASRLAATGQATGAQRLLALVGSTALVATVGVVDVATGPHLSLSVFYFAIAVATAVYVGGTAGLAAAVQAAIVWTTAEALATPRPVLAASIWNVILRSLILGAATLLIVALRSALESARASERRARSFLAVAAHQLRTPVAGIGAATEALLMNGHNEMLLAQLATESRRTARLVNDLLRVARLDQGEPLLRLDTDLVALCEEEVDRQASWVPEHVGISIRHEGSGPRIVPVDPGEIREALANLLDNARRHARSRIDVTVRLAADAATIAVRDDGDGLRPGQEDRAFERFVRLDDNGGTGLGLPIARGIARAHGGDLCYDAPSFVMRVPFVPPAPGLASADAATQSCSTTQTTPW